jgi:hypothetical protein
MMTRAPGYENANMGSYPSELMILGKICLKCSPAHILSFAILLLFVKAKGKKCPKRGVNLPNKVALVLILIALVWIAAFTEWLGFLELAPRPSILEESKGVSFEIGNVLLGKVPWYDFF